MADETAVFNLIDETIEPFTSYRKALEDLRTLPPGYAMCFAIHYVHADIFNGGISQLYANSTWPLIIDAVAAAETANATKVARVLREIIFYYHQKGRSKLKRRIDAAYFADMPEDWDKSLAQLEDEYFQLEAEIEGVIPKLCAENDELFKSSEIHSRRITNR